MREVLTPQQVADYLQLSTGAVYRLIRQRKLAASRVGRGYQIARNALDEFLLANSTRPETRQALFNRANAIAERNAGLNSDDILEELEREDEERKRLVGT